MVIHGIYTGNIEYLTNFIEINELERKYKVKNDKINKKFLTLKNLVFLRKKTITNKVIVKNKGEVIKGITLCKYII